MNKKTIFEHVHENLRPYRWGVTIFVSFLFACIVAGGNFYFQIQSKRNLVQALSPYLNGLISSLDRPELLKITQSLKNNYGADFIVTKKDKVLSSTRSFEEIDLPVKIPKQQFSWGGIYPLPNIYILNFPLGDNQSLVLISPMNSLFLSLAFSFLITFLICLLISAKSTIEFKKALKKALFPINQLMQYIDQFHFSQIEHAKEIDVLELETMRLALLKSHRENENSKDQLAQEKAKELTIKRYESLIHDLHNPITALSAVGDFLTDESADDETRKRALGSAKRLIPQILSQVTVAKENLGKLDSITFVQEDLREFTSDICKDYTYTTFNKKLIQLECSNQIPVIANFDKIQLRRALSNLIDNALNFSKEAVHIEVKNSELGPAIRVSDDGPGIEESKLTLYMQGRATSSNNEQRQAFGLASANRIIKSLGGKLIYIGRPEGGSTFEIRLNP
jgi:signal transduction histidine kinase